MMHVARFKRALTVVLERSTVRRAATLAVSSLIIRVHAVLATIVPGAANC